MSKIWPCAPGKQKLKSIFDVKRHFGALLLKRNIILWNCIKFSTTLYTCISVLVREFQRKMCRNQNSSRIHSHRESFSTVVTKRVWIFFHLMIIFLKEQSHILVARETPYLFIYLKIFLQLIYYENNY